MWWTREVPLVENKIKIFQTCFLERMEEKKELSHELAICILWEHIL
jgi:hypothetical protein